MKTVILNKWCLDHHDDWCMSDYGMSRMYDLYKRMYPGHTLTHLTRESKSFLLHPGSDHLTLAIKDVNQGVYRLWESGTDLRGVRELLSGHKKAPNLASFPGVMHKGKSLSAYFENYLKPRVRSEGFMFLDDGDTGTPIVGEFGAILEINHDGGYTLRELTRVRG